MTIATLLRLGASLCALSATAACGGGSPLQNDPPPTPVVGLQVSPREAVLEVVGDSVKLQAAVSGADGEAVVWAALDPAIVSVSAAGSVRSLSPGEARVIASVRGKSDTARIQVRRQAVATITLSPTNPLVAIGQTVQMRAVARDANGTEMPGVAWTWSSSSEAVATVSADGIVTGRAAGAATISVAGGGKTASTVASVPAPVVATVTLSPANPTVAVGQSVRLLPEAREASGAVMTDVAWTWSSSNAEVANVTPEGYVFGRAAGTSTITATGGGKSASVTATVPAPAVPPVVLATHDFESGTWGPYGIVAPPDPSDLVVMADPTGAGQGRVARVRFRRTPGQSLDDNNSFDWSPATGFTFGQTVHFRGRIYIPAPQAGLEGRMRKLVYVRMPSGNLSASFAVFKLEGQSLAAEVMNAGRPQIFRGLGQVQWGKWHTVEFQITVNSSETAADGALRMWLDGVQVLDRTDRQFFTRTGANERFKLFMIGQQMQSLSDAETFDEVRYWDNVTFSTGRIVP